MSIMDNLKLNRAADLEEMEVLNHTMAHGFSYQAQKFLDEEHPQAVCRSGAGFYIGCWDETGPCARDSQEYWVAKAEADVALEDHAWTQRMEP